MTRQPSHATRTAHVQLHAHLDATDDALRHAHAHMVAQVQPALTTLLREVQQERANGEEVNIAWLQQQQRMARLTQAVKHEAHHFEDVAQMVIAAAQGHSTVLGEQAAMSHLAERKHK